MVDRKLSDFNQQITGWDTCNVTNMSGMFANATVFNKPLGTWEVYDPEKIKMKEEIEQLRRAIDFICANPGKTFDDFLAYEKVKALIKEARPEVEPNEWR